MSSAHFVAAMAGAGVPGDVAEEMWDRLKDPAGYERWSEQVARVGYCVRPVRLKAKFTRPDGSVVYTTAHEPGGVLLKRCGNRRESVCPACSFLHRGDDWQVFAAGIAGGRKGVPDTVATHPMCFLTLTAPSCGAVHSAHDGRCRPRRDKPPCEHGKPMWCQQTHGKHDPQVGQPFCEECYEYDTAVLFNFRASELWARFMVALRRALAAELGIPTRKLCQWLRVSFGKVAQMQRRALVHYHAVVRLDRPGAGWQPPEVDITTEQLERAIRTAAEKVRLNKDGVTLRWGDQVDVQHIGPRGDLDGQLTPEKVAVYLSKYITKSAGDIFGLDGIVRDPEAARRLGASPHVVRMMETTMRLAPRVEGLAKWVHMLGFRGHIASKSRMFSTTLGAIQQERIDHERQRGGDISADNASEETTLLVGEWEFEGIGHQTEGDRRMVAEGGKAHRELYVEWRTGGL